MAEILKERGFFWWFNEPKLPTNSKETSVPALLTITDDGQITLEADGSLCLKDEYQDWSKPRTFPEMRRIAGRLTSSGKYVLLEASSAQTSHSPMNRHNSSDSVLSYVFTERAHFQRLTGEIISLSFA